MAILSSIRRWHLRDQMPIREIARRTGLSRNTIRKYLANKVVEPRYLLARLTQHVEMAFSGLKVPGSLEPFTNLEIEHILPNKPEADLRAKWATENPGMVYDDYKDRLGNLTLLEKPINIVAGNDFYTAKQVEYSKSGNYLTRSLVALTDVGQNTSISRINAKLEAFPSWNAATIEKRHAMLISLARDVWKTTPIDV